MQYPKLTQVIILFALLTSCQGKQDGVAEEALFTAYCGGCHLTPDPTHLPKNIWDESVLPEMAARLGYQYRGYDAMAKYSMEERLDISQTGAYPAEATIDSATWHRLHQWVLAQAPDTIAVDGERQNRHRSMTSFIPEPVSLDTVSLATITYVDFLEGSNEFVTGDAFGNLFRFPDGQPMPSKFQSPVMTFQPGDGTLVTEIGFMNPSDRAWGRIHLLTESDRRVIASKMKRPVYSRSVDLNGDGAEEILICEFGNYGGQFSMLVRQDTQYRKQTLLPVPGTIKFDIQDMDGDGRSDLILLASQGNEGIFILYQEEGLTFRTKQVVRMGPEFGSSWFELVDYDQDGDLDIAYANGDNADYSIFSKPYHGVRLFENSGDDLFTESWFYPIYGATRILPEDYDLDGDIDFAVLSFFPDFGHAPAEGFVYLENLDAEAKKFQSFTFEGSRDGRWLVMDAGDIDHDGDTDLLLGAFMLYPGSQHHAITERWIDKKVDLYLLRNKTYNHAN